MNKVLFKQKLVSNSLLFKQTEQQLSWQKQVIREELKKERR